MYLYNGKSSITWQNYGFMTADEMKNSDAFAGITEKPSVIFDNGSGMAYSWRFLESVAEEYGVPVDGDPAEVFDNVVKKVSSPKPDPIDELSKRVETVEDTASTALANMQASIDAASDNMNALTSAFEVTE